MQIKTDTIYHKTPTNHLTIDLFRSTIPIKSILVQKDRFYKLCKKGCVNFENKYSCPPYSPHFDRFSKNCNEMVIFCYRLELNQYSYLPVYSRIRAGNAVLKSKIDRILYEYKAEGFKIAGSGSCRACKPCAAKTNEKCKKPNKLIYSLESLGVDVNHLVKFCFGFELQWYCKKNKNPAYTCTVGGVLQ